MQSISVYVLDFNQTLKNFLAVKRILRYLKGTDDLSLFYPKSNVYDLKGYSDADYAEDLVNRKCTLGTVQFLGRGVPRNKTSLHYPPLKQNMWQQQLAVPKCFG